MTTYRTFLRSVLDRLSRFATELSGRDLATFGRLLEPLREIERSDHVPAAMHTQAKRLAGLLEKAVMGDTPADSATAKLQEGIEKMVRAFEGFGPGSLDDEYVPAAVVVAPKASSPPPTPPPTIEVLPLLDAESLQLRKRFAESQILQLEDFEVAILEQEKGNPAGREFVTRHLHTLKGEFGVLDLPHWAHLIHEIETGLAEQLIGVELLLRFKDFLQERLPRIASGDDALQAHEIPVVLGFSPPSVGTSPLLGSQVESVSREDSSVANPVTDFASVMSNDTSFLVDFIAEGGDHIHTIEKSLLRLETCPTDEEALALVFRSCHTIKGLAGFLELCEIQVLAHAAESLMDRARNHEFLLRPEHVDLLLEVTDTFKDLINGLESVLSGEEYIAPEKLDLLIQRLRHPDNIAPMPSIHVEEGKSRLGEVLIQAGLVDEDSVVSALDLQSQGDDRPLGEILMDHGNVSARDIASALGSQIETRKPVTAPVAPTTVEETIRVPVQRLDVLIDAIGEAVIAQSMAWADPAIRQISDLGLEKKIAQASLMMRQIQELSMSLRMVSIRSTFQKMTRLVRDLSRKLDKQIEMVMEGEETELDKTVVENIGDPLIHMVRNSLDHGLEMPDARIAAGKNPTGTIHLRAYHKAGNVFIEIQDDGKGLNRDAILAKSIASGVAKVDQHYTDAEVYQMIFAPGLSTAAAVTDISGRGVGMDVVKRNIEALRGTIDIHSEKGKGSKFTIRLPLTLAIINGMVVRVDQERYIVPTLSILTTVRPEPGQLQTVVGKGEILNMRGELIRLIRLQEVFTSTHVPHGVLSKEFQVVVIVEDTVGRKVGILVDEILEQQQVVIKNLGSALGEVMGISGGAIMNDGSVSLIVDVGGIIKAASE
ncbi:MAG: hypothetical protein RL318_1070 [Fibrobacterota bacterium]